MSGKVGLPEDAFEELRCSQCKLYLSQTPVYMYRDKEEIHCGRCVIRTEPEPIQVKIYEAVANYINFPCRYKNAGCLEQLFPAQLLQHEESCYYKLYGCPFIPQGLCQWQGPGYEMYAHYDDTHKMLALESPTFEIDFVHKYEENRLFCQNGQTFVIQLKCDTKENIFWLAVRYVGKLNDTRKYTYEVELSSQETTDNTKKLRLPVMPVHDDSNMTLDTTISTKLDTADVFAALGDPCAVICTVNIIEAEIDRGMPLPITKTVMEGVNEEILRELECPVCVNYMIPPIHQCVQGHSICNVCKPDMIKCPICQSNITTTRNYTLENLTKQFKYYCKYREYDCCYVGNSKNIRQHENVCVYGPFGCPISDIEAGNSCTWTGKFKNIMSHVKQEHEDNATEVEIVSYTICYDVDDSDCYVFQLDNNQIFRLLFNYVAQTKDFYFGLQLIGPPEESEKYLLVLDIIHQESNQRLFIRRRCGKLTKFDNAFKDGAHFIKLPLQLLQPLIENEELLYKFHVVKT